MAYGFQVVLGRCFFACAACRSGLFAGVLFLRIVPVPGRCRACVRRVVAAGLQLPDRLFQSDAARTLDKHQRVVHGVCAVSYTHLDVYKRQLHP